MSRDRRRALMRWPLAALYLAAGLAHIRNPAPFLAITPDFVPFAPQVILTTGVAEIAGALALLARPTRRAAGIALAAYALAVWPANFKHAWEGIELAGLPSGWWYHGPRLALQPVLIWWALFSSGVTDWPRRR